VCPYLRLEANGILDVPANEPTEDHRCVAIGGPVVLSAQQQGLVCLLAAHVDCPRYQRAPGPQSARLRTVRTPAVPRAIGASLVVLAVSAVISFGFVMHRGGIDLVSGVTAAPSDAAAVVATSTPAPASPAPTSAASPVPTLAPSPAATPAPSPRTVATASPRPSPTPSAPPSPAPTPRPTPTSAPGTASASRLAVLTPCPGQAGCYVYTVRPGDNLFSIAHWFGVPLSTIYAMNPTVQRTGIHPGMSLRIPTPTR
jgi:hypothetical protein